MKQDIYIVEQYMKVNKDEELGMALSKLRDILVAWKKNKHIDKMLELKETKKLLKGA